jgi:pimeloyl-ACP methyl ester carboxylesterase
LSVPYAPRSSTDILTGLEQALGPHNYQSYFQTDAAQQELEADVRRTMRTTLIGLSGDNPDRGSSTVEGWRAMMGDLPDGLPSWLSAEDLDVYTERFEATGFLGALNWYRVSRTNWELLAPWHHAPLLAPTLFVGGDADPVLAWPGMRDYVGRMQAVVPNLTRAEILEGCGHWTQQERPDEVNELLLEFLAGLPRR